MFQPQFRFAQTAAEAAEIINVPHEPKAVLEIISAIEFIAANPPKFITEYFIRSIHQHICYWLPDRGRYRRVSVMINGEVLPSILVPAQMYELHPFYLRGDSTQIFTDLRDWYAAFENIHPFEDGNGRVGGAIIAGISAGLTGKILTPKED